MCLCVAVGDIRARCATGPDHTPHASASEWSARAIKHCLWFKFTFNVELSASLCSHSWYQHPKGRRPIEDQLSVLKLGSAPSYSYSYIEMPNRTVPPCSRNSQRQHAKLSTRSIVNVVLLYDPRHVLQKIDALPSIHRSIPPSVKLQNPFGVCWCFNTFFTRGRAGCLDKASKVQVCPRVCFRSCSLACTRCVGVDVREEFSFFQEL